MKKVLIIGGSGFVGRYLAEYFRQIGYCVKWTARTSGDYHIDFSQKVNFESVFGTEEFDLVVSTLNSYTDDIAEAIRTNVEGAVNIINCFNQHTHHIIFISSIFALHENSNSSVYAFSKWMAESAILYLLEKVQTPITILRFSQIFDQNGRAKESQKGLYYFVDAIKEKRPICLFAKHEHLRSFMPIEVLCRIVDFAFTNKIYGQHSVLVKPYLSLLALVNTLAEQKEYSQNLITLDSSKDALSYYIPSSSSSFEEVVNKIDVRTYLKTLVL